jgi:hypothetical protein
MPEWSRREGRRVVPGLSAQHIWASAFEGRRGAIDLSSRTTFSVETTFPPLAPRAECGFSPAAVVMNADGSRGVAADVRFGARIRILALLATAFSAAVLLAGVLLVARALADLAKR